MSTFRHIHLSYRHGTGEVPGSNPGKGKNVSKKISKLNYLNWNGDCIESVNSIHSALLYIAQLNYVQRNVNI